MSSAGILTSFFLARSPEAPSMTSTVDSLISTVGAIEYHCVESVDIRGADDVRGPKSFTMKVGTARQYTETWDTQQKERSRFDRFL
jgi:hypothetical protein